MSEVVFENPFIVRYLRVSVGSEPEHFDVFIELTSDDAKHKLNLFGGMDIEDVTLVFGASRISVEKNTNDGLDFSLYTLCITNDSYMELTFNSFEIQHAI